MRMWKLWVAAFAPLLLSACLWGPGKFTSDLAVRKNGTFVLDYRGEILLQLPNDMTEKEDARAPWTDDMARCYANGRAEIVYDMPDDPDDKSRPCTPAELAKLKADYEKAEAEKAAKKRQQSHEMARMFGLPGADDESNRRFAANLMKYEGWRSVRYRGKGVFDVDYHFEGHVGQDFAFPIMPDSDVIIPFIMIRQRVDGSVMVSAPAMTGGSGPFAARARTLGVASGKDGPPSRAEGRFTITTDSEILTNNSEDGPSAHPTGRQIHWDVGPGSTKIPEMLVRLR